MSRKYFSHLVFTETIPYNLLHKHVCEIALEMNHVIIDGSYPETSMQQFQETMISRIDQANKLYKDSCEPVELNIWNPSALWSGLGDSNECVKIYVDGLFKMHLIPVRSLILERILIEVCNALKLPPDLLKSTKRDREITDARHVYCYRARKVTKESLSMIGSLINRNHSTVLSSIRQCEDVGEVRMKYEMIYGTEENKIQATTMATEPDTKRAAHSPEGAHTFLPHQQMEEEISCLQEGESAVQTMPGGGSTDTSRSCGPCDPAGTV